MAKVHQRDPERGFRFWRIDEIYTDSTADAATQDRWIPNVKDMVWKPPHEFYEVAAIDPVTSYPTLVRIDPTKGINDGIVDPDNLNAGLRVYQPHVGQRIFVDTLTNPFECTLDVRYRIYDREAVNCKFFLGTNTTESGRVISQKVNANGAIVSELVDLYNIWPGNTAIKRPESFHTTVALQDGDIVTMVVYSATGQAVEERAFMVRLAKNVVGPNSSGLYIEDIELITSLLSKTDPTLIEIPMGTPVATSTMRCRVHYSDGNYVDYEVDGAKIKLHGLNSFNLMSSNEKTLVLTYTLGEGESAVNADGLVPFMAKKYTLVARRTSSEQHSFRIWIEPYYSNNRWALRYHLTDLDNTVFLDVTDHVTVAQQNGQNFNPVAFGIPQRLLLSLPLDDVMPGAYPGIIQSQVTDITLFETSYSVNTVYTIDYTTDGNNVFGTGAVARAHMDFNLTFTVDGGVSSEYDWLSSFYRTMDPLYDTQALIDVPEPTHFRLEHAGRVIGTYPVSDFARTFSLGNGNSWTMGEPMNVIWLLRVNSYEKTLGISPFGLKFS